MSVPGKMHSFFVPGISLIGVGACHGIPHYVHTYHITKPLIVTDKGIVNTGILKIITDILDGDNIPYSIYDKTVPNPTDENVTEGVASIRPTARRPDFHRRRSSARLLQGHRHPAFQRRRDLSV